MNELKAQVITHDDGALSQAFSIDGKTVTLVTEEAEEEMWVLSILGKNSQATTWHEFFESSKAAFEEGYFAIASEGIETFYSSDHFSYLNTIE
jgi:hypothetical protein